MRVAEQGPRITAPTSAFCDQVNVWQSLRKWPPVGHSVYFGATIHRWTLTDKHWKSIHKKIGRGKGLWSEGHNSPVGLWVTVVSTDESRHDRCESGHWQSLCYLPQQEAVLAPALNGWCRYQVELKDELLVRLAGVGGLSARFPELNPLRLAFFCPLFCAVKESTLPIMLWK